MGASSSTDLKRWPRWIAVVVLCVVVLGGGAFFVFSGGPSAIAGAAPPAFSGGFGPYEPAENPEPTPDVAFLDANGDPIKLDAYRGKVILLNFWATWCAPCVKELPALAALDKDIGGEDFAVLLVSVDRGGAAQTEPFLADLGVTDLDSALDTKSALAREMGALGLPTTFVIDRTGLVRGRLQGDAEWNSEPAQDLIRYYINEG
jgi:thiol-disulfide isomerase/thioredoxin